MTSQVPATSKCIFTAEPDDALKCLICLEVAVEPRQHEECGRLFCKKCLDSLAKDQPCPNCSMENPKFFKDVRGFRDIKRLEVKCSAEDCSWEGTFGEVDSHSASCEYALVPCPNNCKDEADRPTHLQRNALEEHINKFCPNREMLCRDCGLLGTSVFIAGSHSEECMKKRVPCPNDECSRVLQRQNIKRHQNNCEHTMIPCKYTRLGCTTSMKRKSIKFHEANEDKAHLDLALYTVMSHERAISTTRERVRVMEVDKSGGFTFKLPSFSENRDLTFFSPSFYSSCPGYHFEILVCAGGYGEATDTHVSVYAHPIEGRYDGVITWPFTGSIFVTILNQLADSGHYTEEMQALLQDDVNIGVEWGLEKFVALSKLDYDFVEQTEYLKDDTLYFRVQVKADESKPWLKCTNSE